jgi:hypothetical protein
MAIRRTSNNSINNAVKLSTGFASAAIPNPPTIGTATATSDVAATVEYTAAVLGATASTFTATSNPGSVTGTGSSPITVTGLTASTAYTFTVTAGNANGTSAASSASNSITTNAPSGSFESIATVTVGSGGAADIEFTSIPSTYSHLQIRMIAKTNRALNRDTINLTFNGTSGGTAYSRHGLYGDGTSVAAEGSQSQPSILILRASGNSSATNIFGAIIVDILDYQNTNKYKTVRSLGGADFNGSGEMTLYSGSYQSTSAISSISMTPFVGTNFLQYSSFALYGIKGV